jgi:hypothetical protein
LVADEGNFENGSLVWESVTNDCSSELFDDKFVSNKKNQVVKINIFLTYTH